MGKKFWDWFGSSNFHRFMFFYWIGAAIIDVLAKDWGLLAIACIAMLIELYSWDWALKHERRNKKTNQRQ